MLMMDTPLKAILEDAWRLSGLVKAVRSSRVIYPLRGGTDVEALVKRFGVAAPHAQLRHFVDFCQRVGEDPGKIEGALKAAAKADAARSAKLVRAVGLDASTLLLDEIADQPPVAKEKEKVSSEPRVGGGARVGRKGARAGRVLGSSRSRTAEGSKG